MMLQEVFLESKLNLTNSRFRYLSKINSMGSSKSKTVPQSPSDPQPMTKSSSKLKPPLVQSSAKKSWQRASFVSDSHQKQASQNPHSNSANTSSIETPETLGVRHAQYQALNPDPDQTIAKTRLSGRHHQLDLDDSSQLGQESTLSHNSSLRHNTSYPGCGLVGLRNLGNTCYMNSILQCVCHTPGFSAEFLTLEKSQVNTKSKLRGRLAESFSQLLQKMRSAPDHSVIIPSDIKTMIGRISPQFGGYGQEDAQEFLRLLLDGLNLDLNRVAYRQPYKELSGGENYGRVAEQWFNYSVQRDDSLVTDYFRGQLLTLTTCSRCKSQSIACDTFLDLSVPIPKGGGPVSLSDCLQAFTSKAEVDGFKCEHCKKPSRSTMQMTLWKLPRVLVIHLKRFSSNSWRREKINTPVSFPSSRFNVSPFAPYSTDPSIRTPYYNLFAVSHHVGDMGFGHYFS